MAAELNFSEFQAIRKRHAREELDDEEEKAEERQQRRTAKRKDAPDAKKDDGEDEDDSLRERAGFFAEMHETQLIFALLIVADVACSAVMVLSESAGTFVARRTPLLALRLMEHFTGFTTFLFFFELCALVLAFQERFFLHPGYALDAVVVCAMLRAEILLDGDKEVRLLGFLRLWRLSRLHETLVAAERAKTEDADRLAGQEQDRALKLEVEKARLDSAVAEGANARARLEKMCRAFKDEIDTLNEALVIAARDIAEAADSEFESDDDDGGDDDDDELDLLDSQDAYRKPPRSAVEDAKQARKKKAPATRFVVDPSGAYTKTS